MTTVPKRFKRIKYNLFSKRRNPKRSVSRGIIKYSNVNSLITNYYDQTTYKITQPAGGQILIANQFTCDTVGGASGGVLTISPVNYAELKSLYDCYKINKIVFTLIPTFNVNGLSMGASNSNNYMPGIHSVIDYNDSVAPTSISQLLEYKTYKYTRGGQIHKRVFTPKLSTSAASGGTTQSIRPRWINFPAEGVTNYAYQYGIKVVTDPVAGGTESSTVVWNIRVKFYLQLKNNK